MAEGVSFSMDDFGTGYSNIVRVASMPVKLFKLDKSIIQSAFDSEVSYMVMFNMIKIIKSLGKEIVAIPAGKTGSPCLITNKTDISSLLV